MFVVAAFYKFVALEDYVALQKPILDLCLNHGIYGTILLAREGINSTVAGSRTAIDTLLTFLRSDSRLSDLEHKESFASQQPFHRMKVRLKQEIVTMKVPYVDPNRSVGQYLTPREWNDLLQDPEVVVLDTRNDYEYTIGTFKGSLNPKTEAFSELPAYVNTHLADKKDAKIAMHCTGGIRCEKATSYLIEQGFKNVYHLKGGILKYLEEIPESESLWEGECFVFDQRVAVQHGLKEGTYKLCYGCQQPVSQTERASPEYKLGICCPKCYPDLNTVRRKRLENRQHQVELCAARGEKHIGH